MKEWIYQMMNCLLAVYYSLPLEIFHLRSHQSRGCWIISNLCCALSVWWFTLRTIFSKLVIYTIILLWFCWTCMVFQLTLVFIHFLSYMVHPTKSLTSLVFAQACPNKAIPIWPFWFIADVFMLLLIFSFKSTGTTKLAKHPLLLADITVP